MGEQVEKKLSFILRDEYMEEDNWYPEESRTCNSERMEQAPSVVVVITAALMACGLLDESSVIKSIRYVGTSNPWKMAGIMDLMAGRELFR